MTSQHQPRTTYRIDAAMDVLVPRRQNTQIPRNSYHLDDIGQSGDRSIDRIHEARHLMAHTVR